MPPLRLPSTPEARAPGIAAALSAIKESDPGFDAASVLQALPGRYLAVRRAAARGDEARLRAYLTPALLQSWSDSGPRLAAPPDGGGDLSVQEVRLVWADRALGNDRLTVGVDSLALDGDDVRTLTEYWTLARQVGTVTDTVATGECADCGAPAVAADDVCRYCGTELPGPLRGWQLDCVDEEIDWYEGSPGLIV